VIFWFTEVQEDMAFIGIALPHETARLLHTIDVPGRRADVSTFHITMLYLGKDVPIEQLGKAIVAAYAVSSQWRPFAVSTKRVSCFPPDEKDGVPIICRVDSSELHDLQANLKKALDKAGVDYSKKFPEYKPHVTLSYADAPMDDKIIDRLEWGAHEMTLWGGDEGDDRLSCTFPFSLQPTKEAVTRSVIRFATRQSRPRKQQAVKTAS